MSKSGLSLVAYSILGSLFFGFIFTVVAIAVCKAVARFAPKSWFLFFCLVTGASLYVFSLVAPVIFTAEAGPAVPGTFTIAVHTVLGATVAVILGLGLRKQRSWADFLSRMFIGAFFAGFMFYVFMAVTRQPAAPVALSGSTLDTARQAAYGISSSTESLLLAVSSLFGAFGGVSSFFFRRIPKGGDDPCREEEFAYLPE